MSNLKKSVLIVEDEYLISLGLTAQIEDMGLKVCATADSADAAVIQAEATAPPLS